ncbi:uncharacterized protein B0H18DRAFT_957639 [Fomitopsis serialis]|uniref:uncharacterized protein n=1 Tax=Fomitopsis serialis TaxID=139415 RepID=UPI002007220E|nr:uncharacterized protein B0H18DRAFT_957639 [Neoantrodia serialis]KAH9919085.1 hypothetical protein B0H18DRAFT_957639 [Neoantrodia serialis]
MATSCMETHSSVFKLHDNGADRSKFPRQEDAVLTTLLDNTSTSTPIKAALQLQRIIFKSDPASTGQFAISNMPVLAEAHTATPDEPVMPQAQGSMPSPFMYSPTSGRPVGVVELTKAHSVRAVRRGKRTTSVACLFCRRRKIACGGPPVDNPDKTCMQCKRRRFTCEYPEGRNGAREYKFKQTHFAVDAE